MFYFALGSYVVTKSNQEKLRTIAAQIMNSPAKTVLIYGHTDSLGGVNNLILSKNRANAIAKQLRPLLKGKTIRVGWFAASKPAVQGKTNAANAKNRRVEIWIK
jgi:outer membrane protein OmpA-like peptidoglycan-associated protein